MITTEQLNMKKEFMQLCNFGNFVLYFISPRVENPGIIERKKDFVQLSNFGYFVLYFISPRVENPGIIEHKEGFCATSGRKSRKDCTEILVML